MQKTSNNLNRIIFLMEGYKQANYKIILYKFILFDEKRNKIVESLNSIVGFGE